MYPSILDLINSRLGQISYQHFDMAFVQKNQCSVLSCIWRQFKSFSPRFCKWLSLWCDSISVYITTLFSRIRNWLHALAIAIEQTISGIKVVVRHSKFWSRRSPSPRQRRSQIGQTLRESHQTRRQVSCVLSCHVMSCHVMSGQVFKPTSNTLRISSDKTSGFISYHVRSHVMSCHVMSGLNFWALELFLLMNKKRTDRPRAHG